MLSHCFGIAQIDLISVRTFLARPISRWPETQWLDSSTTGAEVSYADRAAALTSPKPAASIGGAGRGCGTRCREAPSRRLHRRLHVIDKLEFFIALAREQSFSRAAEVCGVTQPTFSAGIKQLEDTLGVPLVNRTSRFHGLTPEGERALEWSKRIVADSRAMRQDVRSTRASLDGHLRIAAIPTVLGMVTSLTSPFRVKHPGVRFTVLSLSSREILSMLDSFEIDAGLTYLDNEPVGQFKTIPLYVEQYRLLTSAHCPLGERASVTWSEVAYIPLCLLTSEMQNRRIIDRLVGNANAPPMLESNSMVLLFAHVRTGRWASIMPEKFAEVLGLPEPLRSIPIIAPREGHKIGLVTARREPMSPLVRALCAEALKIAIGD